MLKRESRARISVRACLIRPPGLRIIIASRGVREKMERGLERESRQATVGWVSRRMEE